MLTEVHKFEIGDRVWIKPPYIAEGKPHHSGTVAELLLGVGGARRYGVKVDGRVTCDGNAIVTDFNESELASSR